VESYFTALSKRQMMLLLTAVTFGGQDASEAFSFLPEEEGELLKERAYIGWFGVRGVGSLYYLAFALTHGLAGPEGRHLADATLVVVATSILVHGISVTPLMRRYSRRHA
jgi:NhaP-type Na+/H+ or K+/H+ antiporter